LTDAATSLTSSVTPIEAGEAAVYAAFIENVPILALANGAALLPATGKRAVAHADGAILCAASDGRRMATGGDDGRLVEVDAAGDIKEIADEGGKWIDAVALRSDGAIAWTAGRAARARAASGETRSLDLPSASRGLAFMHKGYRLAVAHYNGVSLWFPGAQAKPETLEWKGSHLDVTLSPDGRFLITSMQENALHGWRLSDNKHMRMSGYPAKTRSVSWSPDGKWLATSGADACILWPFQGKDGPMGAEPRECGVRAGVQATRVAFHPTAMVIAVGYEDGMVLLCRVTDGSELLVRRPDSGPGARISALAWDTRGARLLFGGENGAAGLLALPKT
jgi:sugar lactone lactonase YvrE